MVGPAGRALGEHLVASSSAEGGRITLAPSGQAGLLAPYQRVASAGVLWTPAPAPSYYLPEIGGTLTIASHGDTGPQRKS